MPSITPIGPIRIAGTPTQVASTGSSVATAIPNGSDGNRAPFVLVTSEGQTSYVLPGSSSVSVSNSTGVIINATAGGYLLNVKGHTHIAILQGAAGAGRVSIAPVDG